MFTFLVDANTRQLRAWSSHSASELLPSTQKLAEAAFSSLLPEITESQWAMAFASNDPSTQILSTQIHQADGSQLRVRLTFETLTSPAEQLVLVRMEPDEPVTTAVLHRDALTNLPDRRGLAAHLSDWQQAGIDKMLPFALLFIDLDHFKQINDQYGHTIGDQVLTALAPRWQGCLREGDLVARYGGDEFVALVANIKNREEAAPVVERLVQATRQPICIEEKILQVSVTIGIALAASTAVDLVDLISTADRDMYALKKSRDLP